MLGYMLSIKKINLWKVVCDYLMNNKFSISSFSTYVLDSILKNHTITTEENNFLFAEMFKE